MDFTTLAVGLLVALVGLVGKLIWERKRASHIGVDDKYLKFHTRLTLFDALIGVGLAVLLIELPFSRVLIRKEMMSALQYPEIFANGDSLRGRFSEDRLKSFDCGLHRARAGISGTADQYALMDSLVSVVLHGPIRTGLDVTREHLSEDVAGWGAHLLVKEKITYELWAPRGDSLRIPLFAMMDRIEGIPAESLCRFISLTIDNKAVEVPKVTIEEAGGRWRFSVATPILVTSEHVRASIVTRKRIPPTDRWNSFATMPTLGFSLTFRYGEVQDKRNEPQLDIFGLARVGPLRLAPKDEGDGFKRWEYPGWLFSNQSWALAWAQEKAR
jgi:hypothetical protein